MLRTKAVYIAGAVENGGVGFIREIDAIETSVRIARFSPDGEIQYASPTIDSSELQNYKQREEIQEALRDGIGLSSVYSNSFSEKTIYCAICLEDGTILCVSEKQSTLLAMILRIFIPIVLVQIAATILFVLLAVRVSRTVTDPINAINLEHPDEREVYEELRPLVHRINAQNLQIQQQMDELRAQHEAQDQLRREFTANVSHELKTPLTAISGYAEIMQSGMVRPEDMTEFSKRIYSEAQRMITLVGDILRLSKLEERQIPEHKTDVDLYALSQTVLELLRPLAEKDGIQLHLNGCSATVYGVERILEEMIINLCDNAIKYNRRGGKVFVLVKQLGEEIMLCVKDTGIGISEHDIERIFERFYRVDKSHSREIGGTGLGLSIVKHGARFHNARIETESTLNTGTTISIYFPSFDTEKNSVELQETTAV